MAWKPLLCLDFDGVIHSYTSGWKGIDVIPDPPVPGAFEFIKAAQEVFTVCVFSSRSKDPLGVAAMAAYFSEHGWDGAPIDFPTDKPPAHVSIDDRAIMFTGTWPAIEELRSFRPWNRL